MTKTLKGAEGLNNFLFAILRLRKLKGISKIILMILLHTTGWCLLFFLPLFFYPVRISNNNFFWVQLIDKSLLVGFFYFNYYILIPKLFEKKKYFAYLLTITLIFSLYFTLLVSERMEHFRGLGIKGTFQSVEIGGLPPAGIMREKGNVTFIQGPSSEPPPFLMAPDDKKVLGVPKGIIAMTLNNAVSSFALMLLMSAFIRLAYSFFRSRDEKKALENANLNAEVNFLKSQINPHFLFNTLNGIYSQAHSKSESTEYSILKLSELLRYVLYESGEEKVDLAKDIQYLNNYIDLQKLRLSRKITINYNIKGDIKDKMIAPLLLITFIENAFKHGISYTRASSVDIQIGICEETLTLMVVNPVTETNTFAGGGLGLKNVTRRLDLLYPGKYLLDIVHNENLHIVNLKINLEK